MDHPDRVRALVLLNPLTWDTVYSGQSAGLAWLDARLPLAPLARWISLPDPVVSLIVGNQLGPRGRAGRKQYEPRVRAHWTDQGRPQALHGSVRDFPSYRALDTFDPPIGFPPICTIWGRRNRVLSAEAGRRLNRRLRPHTAVELPDCGHLPMVEATDQVTSIITGFLAATGAPARKRADGRSTASQRGRGGAEFGETGGARSAAGAFERHTHIEHPVNAGMACLAEKIHTRRMAAGPFTDEPFRPVPAGHGIEAECAPRRGG
ncbi:alpha/beta fold hydrolase [Nocardia asteroides]